MPEVKFDLDDEAFARLQQYALHEERTAAGQAKILILEILGGRQEYRVKSSAAKSRSKPVVKRPIPAIDHEDIMAR